MGVMDKFLTYMKLNDSEEDDYEGEYDDYDDVEEEPAPAAPARKMNVVRETPEPAEEKPVRKMPATKIAPMRSTSSRKMTAGNGMEVCVIKPTSFEEAREITETLLSNRTVVLNLEGLDVDIAQRIVDFTSGSTFAIGGNLQKISHYIFIITPASVDISGDFPELFSGALDSPLSTGL